MSSFAALHEPEEREKLIQCLGRISKVLLLSNHGALCCGETIEEAFYAAYHIVQVSLDFLPLGKLVFEEFLMNSVNSLSRLARLS